MKLLLDVHYSDERIGDPLREEGHDVVSAEKDKGLRRLDDEPLLEWAVPRRRIIVTGNAKDFLSIIDRWHLREKPHAGCILVPNTVKNHHYRKIITGVSELLEAESNWWKKTMWLP